MRSNTAEVISLGTAREILNRHDGEELGIRDLTHDGLALEMGDRWRDNARHVAAWGRWLFFDGRVWRMDDTLQHMTLARQFLRDVADGMGRDKQDVARALRKADTVAKLVGLARSNMAQAATVDQWDANPWLLGTPAGTVDLRTGTLRPPRPGDYITKVTAVAPAPEGTPAPLWTATFLPRITDGNDELQGYLQRYFGYSLTGSTREHAFTFGHGGGGNGKGVTVNTMMGILGDYAVSIPTEMLVVSRTDRHPEELARLRGIRLAVGSETEEGTRWAEAKIKKLTGGDLITARFMRQNTFEFKPAFKLFIIGNKKPSLQGVDEAMRRRLHLVPFTVTIPKEERDHQLEEKLQAEWPAILRWLIDGCLAWQREGLNAPEMVRAATEQYLESEDSLNAWMDECAVPDPNAWEATGTLFGSWKRWAEAAGEYVGPQKRFIAVLEERGYSPKRQAGTGLRGFRGLRMKPTDNGGRWEP
jgi:putative DNA primase/helicase